MVISNLPVSKADDAADLSEAQKTDPVMKSVIDHLLLTDMPPISGKWRNFPHRRFKQLWPQLCMYDSLLCQKVKALHWQRPSTSLLYHSHFRNSFSLVHEAFGHQGSDFTFLILSDSAYWVGMARDVNDHCSQCYMYKCQISKAPASKSIPFQPVVMTKPWEMVAVDIRT